MKNLILALAVLSFLTAVFTPWNSGASVGFASLSELLDSTDQYGNRHRRFGKDSTYVYDSVGNLKYKKYGVGAVRYVVFDTASNVVRIHYDWELSPDNVLTETFWPSGRIKSREYVKDTVIISNGYSINAYKLFVGFHENGNLESHWYHGDYLAHGVPVGTDKFYYENGNMREMSEYLICRHPENAGHIGELTFRKNLTDFYESGGLKSDRHYEFSYDSDPWPVDLWVYYDEEGNIEKTVQYPLGCK